MTGRTGARLWLRLLAGNRKGGLKPFRAGVPAGADRLFLKLLWAVTARPACENRHMRRQPLGRTPLHLHEIQSLLVPERRGGLCLVAQARPDLEDGKRTGTHLFTAMRAPQQKRRNRVYRRRHARRRQRLDMKTAQKHIRRRTACQAGMRFSALSSVSLGAPAASVACLS